MNKERYTREECRRIVDWYTYHCSISDEMEMGDPNLWFEYKHGQLLEGVEEKIDNIFDWDRWQHLQAMVGRVFSYREAMDIDWFLTENDMEILDMETEKSRAYDRKIREICLRQREPLEKASAGKNT